MLWWSYSSLSRLERPAWQPRPPAPDTCRASHRDADHPDRL